MQRVWPRPHRGSRNTSLPPMGGPVVHDPEHAIGGAVRGARHHLSDQPVERNDPRLVFAATKDPGSVNVPGGEVRPGTHPLVPMLEADRPTRPRRRGGVFPPASLDAGLLIRTQDLVPVPQPATLPHLLVEVEDPARLLWEVGILGEDPPMNYPGPDGVLGKPAPDGCLADRRHDPALCSGSPKLRHAEARPRKTEMVGGLTDDALDLKHDAGGEGGLVARAGTPPPVR
jgi:hypothetical protein